MVKKKEQKGDWLRETLRETHERLQRDTLEFKWVVVEHTPGYNTGGYYDVDVPAKTVVVSPDFSTEEEAEGWMGEHEPDKGNTLLVKRKRKIRREYTDWVWY